MEQENFNPDFKCPMCNYSALNAKTLTNHILKLHRHESSFCVSCNLCPYKTKSYSAFKVHCFRKHKFMNDADVNAVIGDNDLDDRPSSSGSSAATWDEDHNRMRDFNFEIPLHKSSKAKESINKSLGFFFLKLEAKHGLSKSTINCIAEEMIHLLREVGEILRDDIVKLFENNEEVDLKHPRYDSVFDSSSTLNNMHCDAARRKFFKENFKLLEPSSVYMGRKMKRANGRIIPQNVYGYVVPFLESLKALIQTPDVKFCILNSHQSTTKVMKDWCDGEFYKEQVNNNTLCIQIILHVDDIETVNPIGVYRKTHKLTVVSYDLGNIPPQYRSKLHVKQLLAIARSSDVKKFGMTSILTDFIESMNSLKQGVDLLDTGRLFTGILIGTPADTPASNQLWGFKEGVSFAKKCCRTCLGERPKIFTDFTSENFQKRTTTEHLDMCEILNELPKTPKKIRMHWSKQYGINSLSPLFLIDEISIEIGVHDPMHVLLEGVVLLELKCMLQNFVLVEKYFSLGWLNTQLEIFSYTYLEINSKPTLFDDTCLSEKAKISLSASGSLTMIEILPFILAKKVPSDNAKLLNFILLCKITLLSTSPYATKESVNQLATAVKAHHEVFLEEYPDTGLTPKFHYLVHFPEQIRLFGPLRHQWCMRFEAHFNVFKNRKWGSFKNIPLSMSRYHLLRSAYYQSNSTGEPNPNFLYGCDEVKTLEEIQFRNLDIETQNLIVPYLENEVNLPDAKVSFLQELCVEGHVYRPGVGLSLSPIGENLNSFAVLNNIIATEDSNIFLISQAHFINYTPNLNAYQVQFRNESLAIERKNLENPWPLSIRRFNDDLFIVNKYTCFIPAENHQ